MTGLPPGTLLGAAILIPALMALACTLWIRRRRRLATRIGDRRLVGILAGTDLHAVPWRRVVPMLLAALLLGAAAADPRWGLATETVIGGGRDVVLVLDASNSMLVEDVRPNRLEQQRAVARRLLGEMRDDRVGMVVFGGEASVLSPPTRDHRAIEMYLDAVQPAIVPQTGTSIGAGLRQAASLLAAGAGRPGGRVVVLLSDGEPIEPEPERAAAIEGARRAARVGVTVHTVGIGTAAGGPIPDVDPETGRRRGLKVDPFTGAVAESRLDEPMLRELARLTGGTYHHLASPAALNALVARLGGGDDAEATRTERAPQYGWFVALAILLLVGDAAAERRRRN